MFKLVTLSLKLPRNTEVTPEAAKTFLSALTSINKVPWYKKLVGVLPAPLSLEIVSINQQIIFCITCSDVFAPFVTTQIQSNYPSVVIEKIEDPLKNISASPAGQQPTICRLRLKRGNYYPLATYDKFTDTDPLSSVLSILSKAEENEISMVQIALEAIPQSWQSKGSSYADMGTKNVDGTYSPRSDKNIIIEKISYTGFRSSVRVISNSNKTQKELVFSFGVFAKSDGNSFSSKKDNFKNAILRKVVNNYILNILELSTLWHLPSEKIKVPSIMWGNTILSEAPENLPNANNLNEEQKKEINFFAKTAYKNKDTVFGIKNIDRAKHVWIMGKTGTGKSTLIANMAIDDLKKDRGLAVIDPHGDLCETLLNFIPAHRINDVVYFDPIDKEFPISINPLEVRNKEEAELVVSGLMAIFTKVWANVWSARMEYILRNCFLTLAEIPDSTLSDVLKLLSDSSYRQRTLKKVTDTSLIHFWKNEYEKMPDKLQKEAIAPIQNKVGQFVTSPMIRRIIGNPRSTISLDSIMNDGKILLANLSQGRLGEDNAALLGAMLITKLQLVAMRRVDIPEESRKDFYLFVDEFQNFATNSFIKILSEARKYHLSVTLANQYMAQIPDDVQKAIFGNAGTIVTFALGASDAEILIKEFSESFSDKDLINLGRFQIAIKMMIDGNTSRPFLAITLPLPLSKNENREKVIRVSRERWGKKQ